MATISTIIQNLDDPSKILKQELDDLIESWHKTLVIELSFFEDGDGDASQDIERNPWRWDRPLKCYKKIEDFVKAHPIFQNWLPEKDKKTV